MFEDDERLDAPSSQDFENRTAKRWFLGSSMSIPSTSGLPPAVLGVKW